VSRVLCDELTPADRIGPLLAEHVVETSGPPWSGDDVVALVSFAPVTAQDLDRLPALRVVSTPSVGFDHVDVPAATARGIWVCNVPDYCIEEMADHALALLLALVRGVVELDRDVRSGGWDYEAAGTLRRIRDVRLGVVGFGRIGRTLADRAQALGMEVCAHDPLVPDEQIAGTGARAATLEHLLRSSDAISVHAPLTEATRGLIGAQELGLLPQGAFVVNVSRGPLVDLKAVLGALESGRLSGAAVDVLDAEPPTPDAPAPVVPRLIVTPHAGWYSERAEEEVLRRSAQAVRDVLAGGRPANPVNEV
jgi:D-3-phosphoglycerate dehydrogenase